VNYRVINLAYTPILDGGTDLFPVYIAESITALEAFVSANPTGSVPVGGINLAAWEAADEVINRYAKLHKNMKGRTTWNAWAADTYIGIGPYEYVQGQVTGTTEEQIAALTDLVGDAFVLIADLLNYLDLHYDEDLEEDPIVVS
jgi:hypothetical protein